jgi:hypothetical protein
MTIGYNDSIYTEAVDHKKVTFPNTILFGRCCTITDYEKLTTSRKDAKETEI